MVETEKKIEKKVTEASLKEVPTQFGVVIELPDGREVSELGLLVEIYNDLQKVKKSIV